MAQNGHRSPYSYNPDLPSRKWHQKWFNPIISLQNAPPTSHGTPAPTKVEGDVGQAGFQIRGWIPMDEDDDVTDEMLQEENDWWSKPGAPLRPELRASARATSSVPVAEAEKVVELDVMQIDPPNETASGMNGSSTSVESPVLLQPVPVLAVPTSPARLPRSPLSQQIDTEMPDAAFSPVNLSTITTAEELAAPSAQPTHLKS